MLTVFAKSSLFGWALNARLYVFSSYLRLQQLVQYDDFKNVNNLD